MERITLNLLDAEYDAWRKEASRYQLGVDEWVRRAVRLFLQVEIEGTTTITGRPKRLSAAVMQCEQCGAGLGGSTVRRRFCSDLCRVRAWRGRQREGRSGEE